MTVPVITSAFDKISLEQETEPMQTGKSSSWLGEYHWVKLAVSDNSPSIADVGLWCCNQFGKTGSRWFFKHGRFYFKGGNDMSMFILRWS